MTTSKKVTVIGGGIVGLSCAYALVKQGYSVIIIDHKTEATGASYVNAGYLTPSHIIPLASPGMISKGLKWMFNSSSPFYVKPRLNKDFLDWSWKFYKAATPSKVEAAISPIKEINLLSARCYKQMLESKDLGTFMLEDKGLLMLYKTQKEAVHEGLVAARASLEGLAVKSLSEQELHNTQAGLSPDLKGAIHYLCDSHTTPTEIMPALYAYLKTSGVRFITEKVTGFSTILQSDSVINSVYTDSQEISSDFVVLAAGAWSQEIGKKLGINLPIQAGKGYKIDVHRVTGIQYPAILMEAKVAVTPMKGFTRFAGTMELSGINTHIRKERVNAIASAAEAYYPGLKISDQEKAEASSGLRPVSPDGLPYIGYVKPYKNLLAATGHAMMGWSLGPGTGHIIAKLVAGNVPEIDIKAFDPNRKL